MEIVAGMLRNLLCHRGLPGAVAGHSALRAAVIDCALCGCDDIAALAQTCRFLETACACEVGRPHFKITCAMNRLVIKGCLSPAHSLLDHEAQVDAGDRKTAADVVVSDSLSFIKRRGSHM